MLEENLLAWMIEVKGLVVEALVASQEVQAEAYRLGLVPNVPWKNLASVGVLMERRYKHVVLNEDQIPGIAGTTMKVVELIVEQQVYGWSLEELRFQHPYLTLEQVYSALAYYWYHREEPDYDISQSLERIDELRSEVQPSALVAQLRAQRPG